MDWVEVNLKCRVNEEEGPLKLDNDSRRSGKFNRVKSKDWKKKEDGGGDD